MKIVALVALSIFAANVNADTYLCVSEDATGFKYKGEKWNRSGFSTDDSKYILRKMKDDDLSGLQEKMPYGVFQLGDNFLIQKWTPIFGQPFKCHLPN